MKKLLLTLCLLLMAIPCFAQDINWTVTNQATVEWDAVITLENNEPIPEGSVISYEVYLVKSDQDKSLAVSMGVVYDTNMLLTITEEGKYFWGVKPIREVDGEVLENEISWSDDPLVTQIGEQIGLKHYFLSSKTKGLR